MPLVAAAVCPHPPMLVPPLAAGATDVDDVRTACDAALADLIAARPDRLVVVGSGDARRSFRPPLRGTFAPWGLAVPVAVPPGADGPVADLPLSLLVGAYLLGRHDTGDLAVTFESVPVEAPPAGCAALGARLTGSGRVGLLVMGDGSACRGEKAPGYADPRAEPFDTHVVEALAKADAEALLALDPVLAVALHVAGRAPWQVLAGAASSTPDSWRGNLRHYAAPLGVAYVVATWEPA